ncbi:HD domain-containing protein [uncultured Ruminococcus sp.]|uniref:HD domain-containing protein n=1 Tax=uncultured Ruminococcus sp. TaxID=165186 RepID=UPI0025E6FDBD|nr:HD domain-containing protein [uncultured Ruminococcus sp.]
MMNMLEEAIIYATVLHQGKVRKFVGIPYILHPMEVAQILSTMTSDQEIITAGILHDIVEDTDGTLSEIEKRFGKRVAYIVSSESENEYPDEDRTASWKRRKEESLRVLSGSTDIGVKMLWLADKLANIRSLAGEYSARGEEVWQMLHQSDPAMQLWYYRTIAETLELSLNKTGAFKELIKHINFIWPGTFDSEKARFKKYREVSVEGCKLLGRGAKGEVYRYDDELVIKVYNENNTYRDVEREIALSRKAFILGVPTAISFGIVSVGERYGAMFELVDSQTISHFIAKAPGQADAYAKIMSDLAHSIHSIEVTEEDGFPQVYDRLKGYINSGIAYEDETLAEKCLALIDALPDEDHLVHGDFHTGNVFLQRGEPFLIDMDRVSRGHPIAEIADLYYFYVVLGEDDPSTVEKFMGFSYDTAQRFFRTFLVNYLGTEDEDRLAEVTEKASLICYARMVRKLRTKGSITDENRKTMQRYMEKISALADRLDTLAF